MNGKLVFAITIMIALAAADASAATPLILLVTGSAENGRPTIEGTTNLPDGAELMVTLSRRESSYMAQDKLSVKNGRFKSSQFSNSSAPLLPGKYTLEVTGPIAAVQSVSRALGDNYSNYSGPLLRRGRYGTTLKYESKLQIPGQTSSAADAAARKTAAAERVAWLRKSCIEIPPTAERLTGK